MIMSSAFAAAISLALRAAMRVAYRPVGQLQHRLFQDNSLLVRPRVQFAASNVQAFAFVCLPRRFDRRGRYCDAGLDRGTHNIVDFRGGHTVTIGRRSRRQLNLRTYRMLADSRIDGSH
jgi:hypothetical protein